MTEPPYGQPPQQAQPPYGPPPYGQQPPYGPPHYPVTGYPPAGYPPPGWPAQPPVQPSAPAPYPVPQGGAPMQAWQAAPRPAFPHAEPREYHQMYRTWTYRWWRPVVGILLLAVGMIIVLPLLTFPVLMVGVLIENGTQDYGTALMQAGTLEKVTPAGMLYLNLSLAGMVLWAWGLIRVLHQMRPRWLASVRPRLRWKFLFVCMGLAVVALIAQLLVSLLLPESANPDLSSGSGSSMSTGTAIALALVILLTTPLQAAGEEYAFRGYLMQAVGSLSRRRWVALLVTSTLFALAHGVQNFPLFFDRFMFGLIAGWLVIRTGGLEAGIAMHVLNNYLAFGLALAFGSLDDTLSVSQVSWWNIPVTLTQSIVYAALAAWAAKAMKLQRTTRPPVQQHEVEAGAPPGTSPGASPGTQPEPQPLL